MNRVISAILCLSGTLLVHGQGTLIYDQQSSTDEDRHFGGVWSIQFHMPVQSFTPTLSSIDFVRLSLNDNNAFTGTGAVVYVNLRADSWDGQILASTEPVFMGNGFAGFTNFLFPGSVSLNPGSSYFFEPIVSSGDADWRITVGEIQYPGGLAYHNGIPTTLDLWFREGITIPEPNSGVLLLFGLAAFLYVHRARMRKTQQI